MTGTTTTGARAPRWLPAALATGIATLLALALFVGSTGHAAAEESDGVNDEALTDAVAGAEATLAPAIALLSQLVEGGLLPADATDALQRVLDRLRDRAPSPGAICRRAANADEVPGTILERCRDFANDHNNDSTRDPFASCRRAANTDQVPDTILERCRELANDHSDDGTRDPFALCRRAANADSVPETVIERCRNLVDDHGDRDPFALCRRAASADQAPDTVIERCRELANDRGDRLDRPERPDVRPDTRPVRRPQVRPDRARLLGPPVAAQPVTFAGVSLP